MEVEGGRRRRGAEGKGRARKRSEVMAEVAQVLIRGTGATRDVQPETERARS